MFCCSANQLRRNEEEEEMLVIQVFGSYGSVFFWGGGILTKHQSQQLTHLIISKKDIGFRKT